MVYFDKIFTSLLHMKTTTIDRDLIFIEMGYVLFVRSTCPDYSGVNCFGMQWKKQFVSRTRTTNNDLGKLDSCVILISWQKKIYEVSM